GWPGRPGLLVERLAIHLVPGFPGPASTRPRPVPGGGTGAPGAGAGWARCWVLREPAPRVRGAGFLCAGRLLPAGPGGCSPAAGGGQAAVCFLRTAQWTRASILDPPAVGRGGLCVVVVVVHDMVVPSFLGHTVDALAPGADEGRWSLRYAPGSRQPGCDPGVSEWGNPAAVMGRRRRLNA